MLRKRVCIIFLHELPTNVPLLIRSSKRACPTGEKSQNALFHGSLTQESAHDLVTSFVTVLDPSGWTRGPATTSVAHG